VITRVAASHIRVGTFQFFAARRDVEAVRAGLADYAIARHYPHLDRAPAAAISHLLDGVMERQAAARRAVDAVGFIHGVMNTDNMAISGETIDFRPLRLHGRLRSGRPSSAPSTNSAATPSAGQPAAHRAVEPRAPRRDAAAVPP
jgi:uncharacterized protein YdiU (UPF0061 family)